MRGLSYVIALAFLLIGPSLAGSTDRDMPGGDTFTYCGTPVVMPAPKMIATRPLKHGSFGHWPIILERAA